MITDAVLYPNLPLWADIQISYCINEDLIQNLFKYLISLPFADNITLFGTYFHWFAFQYIPCLSNK